MRCAVVLLIVAAGTAACGSPKELPLEPGGGSPDPTATFARVQGEVLSVSCAYAGCHGGAAPQAGLDLSPAAAYGNLVRVASAQRSELARIEPYDPERSYLVLKVRGAPAIVGARMPLGGSLTQVQLDLVENWVRRGAPRD